MNHPFGWRSLRRLRERLSRERVQWWHDSRVPAVRRFFPSSLRPRDDDFVESLDVRIRVVRGEEETTVKLSKTSWPFDGGFQQSQEDKSPIKFVTILTRPLIIVRPSPSLVADNYQRVCLSFGIRVTDRSSHLWSLENVKKCYDRTVGTQGSWFMSRTVCDFVSYF